MNRSNAVKEIRSAIEEQLDSLVHEGNTELSRSNLEDVTREAAYQALDVQMIYTEDVVSLWQSCGMPESPTGKGDIFQQMGVGVFYYILGYLDIEDTILGYVSDHDTAHLCKNCAVAVVNDDFSSESLAATPEQVSDFISQQNPVFWVTYIELFSTCEICDQRGADRVFKVTPKED